MPTGSDEHCRIANATLEEVREMLDEQARGIAHLSDVVENRLDRLIDVVAGKGMIPLDVFRWLVVFVCVFVFAVHFGVQGVGDLIKSVRP